MARDKKDNSLNDKDQAESFEHVIREILQYLVDHPDAKDTPEGIHRWWLPERHSNWGRDDVQAALVLLTSKRWLMKRRTVPSKEFYGINRDRLEAIQNFLRQSGAGLKSSDGITQCLSALAVDGP